MVNDQTIHYPVVTQKYYRIYSDKFIEFYHWFFLLEEHNTR